MGGIFDLLAGLGVMSFLFLAGIALVFWAQRKR